MSKQDAHRLCWKDCAVYITVDLSDEYGSTGVGVERVFNFLYRTWFRDGEAHLDVGHFLGRAVRCWDNDDDDTTPHGGGGVKAIGALVEAHRVICKRVREKMADEGADDDEVFEWNRRHGEFVMKGSFERFFVVVDQARWWEGGVLLVRSEGARGGEGEVVRGEWPVFGKGDQGWAVRMGMGEVVELVRKMEDDGKVGR